MKAVTAYQSDDGQLFANKAACERHDAKLAFDRWYQDNRLYAHSGSSVDTEDVKEWLLSHKTEVLSLLGTAAD